MSSTTTAAAAAATPIPAPTNTINPLPATPAEAASGAALESHAQAEDAAKLEEEGARKAEKVDREKEKCISARKDWYASKAHFAAGVHGFREGGKCVGRVVIASPSLVIEKVKDVRGKCVERVDSETSGDSLVVDKEKAAADKKAGNAERVKAKVAELKERLLAIKEGRPFEKAAKANDENAGVVTAPAPATEAAAGVTPAAAPVAAKAAAAPSKQEKKRMTLDQVRKRLHCYCPHFSQEEEDESEVNVEPRIAGRSQGPREAGSGSLRRTRRRGGSSDSVSSVHRSRRRDQPSTVISQDPIVIPGLPSEEHHGTHRRGRGDDSSTGASGSPENGGSWGRSSGTSVGGEPSVQVQQGGLKARVAVVVRGRLRGGDGRARAFRITGKGKGEGEENATSFKSRIIQHFPKQGREKSEKSEKNQTGGGTPFKQPGSLSTLRLRIVLFISKMQDVASDAMGCLAVLIVEFLAWLSDVGDLVTRKAGELGFGGSKDKKMKKKKVRFARRTGLMRL
ncbi:hypothetical protein DSL72_002872 [Monilinia vaccinii-corymbosi]|uniref:Uncharacterized protein n=1 Tax=Monilinia vaccinii-corymbosi TaxID=61207 RepID=A0A8A3PDY9_9HELO|nr:hypothetical protein DSL72_002872 [Monilinia vaccinii-corymbosi]